MRDYEVTIIIQPQLADEARAELIERISNWMAPEAAEENKPVQNHWGMRQLAYPIKKFTEGYYVMYEASLEPSAITELERNMQYVEDLLRYLVVRKDA